MVHIAALKTPLAEMAIYLSQTVQIINSNPVPVAAPKQDKAPFKIPIKYLDFSDVFLEEKALVLPGQTKFN